MRYCHHRPDPRDYHYTSRYTVADSRRPQNPQILQISLHQLLHSTNSFHVDNQVGQVVLETLHLGHKRLSTHGGLHRHLRLLLCLDGQSTVCRHYRGCWDLHKSKWLFLLHVCPLDYVELPWRHAAIVWLTEEICSLLHYLPRDWTLLTDESASGHFLLSLSGARGQVNWWL